MLSTPESDLDLYCRVKEDYFTILQDIVRIDSPSGEEMALSEHICARYSNGQWHGEVDETGNISFTPTDRIEEERLPLLNAHIDTFPVRQDRHQIAQEEQAKKLACPDFLRLHDGGVTKAEEIQAGFDDKAGVALILYLMHHTDLRFRAILTVQEEKAVSGKPSYGRSGGFGIEEAMKNHPEFFRAALWTIIVDRENRNDIIDMYGKEDSPLQPRIRLCSQDFTDWLVKISADAGYPMEVTRGKMGDAYNIRRAFPDLDVVNLSCGYYRDHKPDECLKIDETLSIMRIVEMCIRERGN
ncbi:hypothetical protein [uncultured Methanofollis sp.]|uniref:hypothetical protein n=1 Tax=uncultured Methanofollis sp. TaxID=262500 RepID=UPI002631E85C|nr:hypothetical protein [uncultured Methanofollis sp.]